MKSPLAIAGALLIVAAFSPTAWGETRADGAATKQQLQHLDDANRLDEVIEIISEMDTRARRELLRAFNAPGDIEFLYRVQNRLLTAEEKPAPQGKHLLRYKFTMGEVLRYQVKHATNVRTTIDGTTQTAISHSDSVKAWKVTDVLPNGEIEFIHLVESVSMSNETPGSVKHTYDSAKDKTPPPGFEAAARAIGVPLTVIRIKPNGKIESREQKQPQQTSAEDMPITLELPEEAIAVGDKWSHAYDVVAERKGGAKMQVRTRRLCRLREVKGGVAVIEVSYEILTPVDPYIRSQLIERLTSGTVRFDMEHGRVVQQQHNVDRRVLGFAGKSSSMHFVAKLSERLLEAAPKVAEVQQASAVE